MNDSVNTISLRPAMAAVREHFAGLGPLRGAEIGVWRGDHAASILQGLPIERLVLVDPWRITSEQADAAQARYGAAKTRRWLDLDWDAMAAGVSERFAGTDKVQVLRLTSLQAAARLVESGMRLHFAYIDGDHRAETVRADLEAWGALVVPGGILAGHDHWGRQPGVVEAVDSFARDRNLPLEHAEKDFWFRLPAPKEDLAHERIRDSDVRWDPLRRRMAWMADACTRRPILDVGCGGGALLGRLLAGGIPAGDLAGIDADWRAVRSARIIAANLDGQVRESPAEHLPWPDGAFGTAILGEILEHVEDPRRVTAEVDRVLAEGGTVVITVPAGGRKSRQHLRVFNHWTDVAAVCPSTWHWRRVERLDSWFCGLATKKAGK